MRAPSVRPSRILATLLLVTAVAAGACTKDDPTTVSSEEGISPADERAAVEKTVRDALAAENAKDARTFLAFWTDKGLQSYDVGTRADVEAGKAENFGADKIDISTFVEVKVTGTTATTLVDAARAENQAVKPLFRARHTLVKQDGRWLIDGFEFLGGPPPTRGEKVVEVKAQEYGFGFAETDLPGNVAFSFVNAGKEPHEITWFKAPGPVTLSDAKKTLENVDGSELKDLPSGYVADHVTFAEPGQTQSVAFAEPLAAGTYVATCYVPEGGFGEDGPVNPDGKPHIQLGMLTVVTVT